MKLYKVDGYKGHAGNKKASEVTMIVQAADILAAYFKYKSYPSVKDIGSLWMPDISDISYAMPRSLDGNLESYIRDMCKKNKWVYIP